MAAAAVKAAREQVLVAAAAVKAAQPKSAGRKPRPRPSRAPARPPAAAPLAIADGVTAHSPPPRRRWAPLPGPYWSRAVRPRGTVAATMPPEYCDLWKVPPE